MKVMSRIEVFATDLTDRERAVIHSQSSNETNRKFSLSLISHSRQLNDSVDSTVLEEAIQSVSSDFAQQLKSRRRNIANETRIKTNKKNRQK